MMQRRRLTTTSKNLRPTRTRSTTLARVKVRVKTKESAGHAERLAIEQWSAAKADGVVRAAKVKAVNGMQPGRVMAREVREVGRAPW